MRTRTKAAPRRPPVALATLALGLLLSSCATAPSETPASDGDRIFVKCCRIPSSEPLVARWAVHTWIDLRKDDQWWRVEVLNEHSGVDVFQIEPRESVHDERWGRAVHVVADFDAEKDAARMAAEILEVAPSYPWSESYRAWPGPNSNTFIECLSQEVDGLWIELYPNAIGKDYHGWLSAGTTTTRLGLELETPYLGAQVGLREGVELHVLGLTLGVGLWPPSLKLPFLPALPWGL